MCPGAIVVRRLRLRTSRSAPSGCEACMLQSIRVSSACAETCFNTCSVNSSGRRQCIAAVAAISSTSTTTAAAAMSRRIILFFRNDLRLRDNVIVHEAVQRVQRGEYAEVSAIRHATRLDLHEHESSTYYPSVLPAQRRLSNSGLFHPCRSFQCTAMTLASLQ